MLAQGAVPLQAKKSPPASALNADFETAANTRWYVVQTQPHCENKAIFHLERQGYRIFCPRIRKTVRHARKLQHKLAPLFANYLFVSLDMTRDPWRSVNGTFGVAHLIMQGETPEPVPRGIIETLQARMNGDGAIDWAPAFKIGQSVRIADGPFADFVGTLEHLDSAGRVRVLLDLLGRSVSVALHSEALLPAA